MSRRLAAILAADVVGFSRLMERDEAGTLEALRRHRRELIDPGIAAWRGRIVKTMGDGVLAEFPSVVEATQCAIDIQRGLAERNVAIPPQARIVLRIGINLGDVIADDEGDIFGEGVNLAARLQALAAPGGICLPANVHDLVAGKVGVRFADAGEHTVKNLARPVRVWRWTAVEDVATAYDEPTPPRTVASPPLAVAILAFTNLSGDPHEEYFADGLTEDLITALAAWRSFPVASRSSSFAFKGKTAPATEIARALGVRYLLGGSVRRSGKRLRVTVHLVDGAQGHQVWADRYDREVEDVFAVQDEITRRVVAVIEPEIERAELKKAAAKRPENLDAWDYYLRGMAHLHQMTKEGNASAREMFRRAIALDPDYGDAYARLSLSFERDLLLEVADDRARAIEQALETAKRAVALDDASAHAHQALSTAYLWANQYDLALAQMNKAVSLNPYDGDAHLALGNRLDLVGRSEEGVREMEAAFQLYPTHPRPHMYMCFLARAYIGLRRYDLAEAWARRALEGRPDYPHAHFILALCLGHLGRLSEARAAVAECERLHPGFADKRRDWRPYLDPARNAHLLAGLRRIDQVE